MVQVRAYTSALMKCFAKNIGNQNLVEYKLVGFGCNGTNANNANEGVQIVHFQQ